MSLHTFIVLASGESDDLEECIKSLKKQSRKSNIIIETKSNNDFIMDIASTYGIGVIVNDSLEDDFNYAYNFCNTPLVTITNDLVLYHRTYTREILKTYKENKDASIIFTNNYFIKDDKKIDKKLIHKLSLLPLKYKLFQKIRFIKKWYFKHNLIESSSITYVKKNISSNIDNRELYKLDRCIYINKELMGKRVDNENNSTSRYI